MIELYKYNYMQIIRVVNENGTLYMSAFLWHNAYICFVQQTDLLMKTRKTVHNGVGEQMRIGYNEPAMTAMRNYGLHAQNVQKSVFRLSSGKKLLADDPAGMMIAQKLQARIRELEVYIRDTERTQDIIEIEYSERMSQQNILNRMRELATAMENDTMSKSDKELLMMEFTELAKEFGLTTFRNTGLEIVSLRQDGIIDDLVFKKDDKVFINGKWTDLRDLVMEGPEDTGDETPLYTGLAEYVDKMREQNISSAVTMSAFASRLCFSLDRLAAEQENAIAALSRIEDVDMAKELVEYLKESILAKCAIAVAAQANAYPAFVLTLLDSITPAKNNSVTLWMQAPK